MNFNIVIITVLLFSCNATKKITTPLNVENAATAQKTYSIDTTKTYYNCFKNYDIKAPIKTIKYAYNNRNGEVSHALIYCLQQAVKEGDVQAREMYYDAIQYSYDDWMATGEKNLFVVENLAEIKTTTAFVNLIKFLDVKTGYGANDVVYEYDAWKIWDYVFNYLDNNQKSLYKNLQEKIYRSVKQENYNTFKKINNRDMDIPQAHKKFKEIFFSDWKAGKINLNNGVKN